MPLHEFSCPGNFHCQLEPSRKWSREDGTNARADHLVCFRVCSPSISAPSEQSASMCSWPVAIQVRVVIAWIRKSTALATDPTSKVLSVGSLISLISLSCWYSEKKSKWKNPLSGHIWEAFKPDWVNLFLVNFPESLKCLWCVPWVLCPYPGVKAHCSKYSIAGEEQGLLSCLQVFDPKGKLGENFGVEKKSRLQPFLIIHSPTSQDVQFCFYLRMELLSFWLACCSCIEKAGKTSIWNLISVAHHWSGISWYTFSCYCHMYST